MNSLSLFGDKKGFTNEKMSYFKNKTQLCDPFDIKLRDRFIDAVFAYHSPSASLVMIYRSISFGVARGKNLIMFSKNL